MSRLVLRLLRVGVGVAMLWYVLTSLGSEFPALSESGPWVAAFALYTLPGVLIEAQRLKLLLAAQGLVVTLGIAVRIVTIATFFGLCIPGGTGGDVMKIYYLVSSDRGRTVEIATLVLMDRVIGMVGLLCTVLFLALLNADTVAEHGALVALVSLAAAVPLCWSSFVRD